MTTCEVHWRPSGGRGEFEFVPAQSLVGRSISVMFESLAVTIPAEVTGVIAQDKPRLRKLEPNNRSKLHLCGLVMAVARLPDFARSGHKKAVAFPLENKAFVIDTMFFDVIEDDDVSVTLSPLKVNIRNSDFEINLSDRLEAISRDINDLDSIAGVSPQLAASVEAHAAQVFNGVNDFSIRSRANEVIDLQREIFGSTNAGSIITVRDVYSLPPVELEEVIAGKEGKLLARLHVYKERDKKLPAAAKKAYKHKHSGRLICEACGFDPVPKYGLKGESCIEAHHKVPIEELQPDSVTTLSDFALICASCHRVIHSARPCLTLDQVLT